MECNLRKQWGLPPGQTKEWGSLPLSNLGEWSDPFNELPLVLENQHKAFTKDLVFEDGLQGPLAGYVRIIANCTVHVGLHIYAMECFGKNGTMFEKTSLTRKDRLCIRNDSSKKVP